MVEQQVQLAENRPNNAAHGCVHCSLPIPDELLEKNSKFCCSGCQFAYSIINDLGLEDYYEIKSSLEGGIKVPSARSGKSFAFLQDKSFLQQFVKETSSGLHQVTFKLAGVHCPACLWLVEKLSNVTNGLQSIRLNLDSAVATVTFDAGQISLQQIAKLLDDVGYAPKPIDGECTFHRREQRRTLLRLGVAGFSAGNVMLLATGMYQGELSGIGFAYETLFRWASLLLSMPALFFSALPFYKRALASLRLKVFHLDLPIALALLVGFAISSIHTIQNAGDVYFDSLCVLVFLLLIGRWLQESGRRQFSSYKRDILYSLVPQQALVKQGSEFEERFSGSLSLNDEVKVEEESLIPADGILLDSQAIVDASVLTGESHPTKLFAGDLVYAGCRNVGGSFRYSVTNAGYSSRLGTLLLENETGSSSDSSVYSLTDRLSSYFVAVVVVVAIATTLYWLVNANINVASENVLAFLVITCPCALGLSAPLAFSAARRRLTTQGLLVKNAAAIEAAAGIEQIVFDKTGTLTTGALSVVELIMPDGAYQKEEAARLISALEKGVHHPVADALRRYANEASGSNQKKFHLEKVSRTSMGIEALVDSNEIRLGAYSWATASDSSNANDSNSETIERLLSNNLSPVALVVNNRTKAIFGVGDSIRPGADLAIARLKALGVSSIILSGDRSEIVRNVGETLGISPANLLAEKTPEEKQKQIRHYCAQKSTAMVGDGVNDAAALSEADFGIGISGGAEVCLSVASATLLKPNLKVIPLAIAQSRLALGVVKRNLVISLLYNVVGGGLAVTGYISPLIAAVLMPLSSIAVVLSSLSAGKELSSEGKL